jgi:ribosomal protein S16
MKKSLFILFAALSVSAASAQQVDSKQPTSKQAPTAEQMAKIQADRMRHQLLLGNDQYDKVYKLCLKRAQKQIARMQEIKKEQAQMSADMKKILNEAQYERYEQQRNQPRMMRGGQ